MFLTFSKIMYQDLRAYFKYFPFHASKPQYNLINGYKIK